MWDTNGRKIKHFLKRLTWHRKKSCKKYQNAIDWYILVLKKEQKFWSTDKWVIKTKAHAADRLKKYGISMATVKETLESRGLTDLLSNVQ
jgi:hypothetical protein